MADARKARARVRLCTTAGLLLAAIVGVSGVAAAEDLLSQAPAPIIYNKPTAKARTVRLENSVTELPAVAAPATNAPVTFEQFQGRRPSGPVDLRPGAGVEPVSYGAPLPSIAPAPTPNADALRAITSRPVPKVSAGFAEPYAGPPYQIQGRWYVPMHEPTYDEVGVASWYGPGFHEKAAATGEEFDENAFTAAHPTLPLPSLVRVTNLENGRSMVVRLNDRGPFVDDRIIDLSRATANALGVINKGTAKVRVQYVGPAPVEANATIADAKLAQPVRVSAPQSAPAPLASEPSPAFEAPLVPAQPAAQQGQGRPAVQAVEADKGYFLQAGTFAELGNAHRLRDKMRDFWPARVEPARIGDSEYFRVLVGPWTDREEADMARERLQQSGTKTLLVSRLD